METLAAGCSTASSTTTGCWLSGAKKTSNLLLNGVRNMGRFTEGYWEFTEERSRRARLLAHTPRTWDGREYQLVCGFGVERFDSIMRQLKQVARELPHYFSYSVFRRLDYFDVVQVNVLCEEHHWQAHQLLPSDGVVAYAEFLKKCQEHHDQYHTENHE